MPANLSQQYRNAEKQYRRASTLQEELACLELMLREIPKHKGTDKMQADLKKRISQTRAKFGINVSQIGARFSNSQAGRSTSRFDRTRQLGKASCSTTCPVPMLP